MSTKIVARIAELDRTMRCTTPFCGRPTMAAAGQGLAETLCKRCIQHRARHGSAWCPSIPAPVLRPYVAASLKWLQEHRAEVRVSYALLGVRGLLDGAGRAEPAQNMKRRPSPHKARVAFARLREAGIKPERILAIHVAVAACLADDVGSHRIAEYRIVQTAKALHRLASGTHGSWTQRITSATTHAIPLHVYPRSSGRVLRVMGEEVDEICGGVVDAALEAVRADKLARFGPHPSALPGYKVPWMIARERAQREAAAAHAATTNGLRR